jgi:hypothetical protein
MSSLGDERRRFSRMVARLLLHAEMLGYEFAIGFVERCDDCPIGHPQSVHRVALGMDLNLYIDGEYITDGRGHDLLHDYWDSIGGAARIADDMNHYSLEWNGVR